MFRVLDHRHTNHEVLGQPCLGARFAVGADGLHREPVAKHPVMTRLIEARGGQLDPRRVDADVVPELHEGAELIDGENVLHAIGEMLGDVAGVLPERLGRLARLPAAATILKRLRQVPVVERGEGLDAVGQQLVHEAVVEIEALGVGRAASTGEHPRPCD